MRYFIELAFRGAPFHGWQTQPGDISVQQTLEHALTVLMRRPTPIVGAGRTDASVNAMTMVAHFDAPRFLTADERYALVRSINAICHPDIVTRNIAPVVAHAHARFDATARTYRYFVRTKPSPFAYPLTWLTSPTLDFDAMNFGAEHLLGRHDFASFAKTHTDVKTTFCTVTHAQWHQIDADSWYFEITADRFLRNMVRATVGTLIEVGRHKIQPQAIAQILNKKDRCAAGTSMPANALFLWNIKYPYYRTQITENTLILL